MTDNGRDDLGALQTLSEDLGFFEEIDARHRAYHVVHGDTLLVTFESGPILWGPEVARDMGASLLVIHADGPTWYRSPGLHEFMDDLTDDGLFDDFDTVLFAGSGMGAYGAAAFSVAAPGAEVLLIQPVATLERARVPWEMRNRDAWKLKWGPRYSFGPESVAAARHVTTIVDPTEMLDAMHASLFQSPYTTQLNARHGGPKLLSLLHGMRLLTPLCTAAMAGELTPQRFYGLWQARRRHKPFLKRLLAKLEGMHRKGLVERLRNHTVKHQIAPRLQRRMDLLTGALDKAGTSKRHTREAGKRYSA